LALGFLFPPRALLTHQTIDPNQDDDRKPFLLLRPFVTVWHWLVPPTQAHADRRSTRSLWIAGGLVAMFCLTLAGLGYAYARPLREAYKDWKAERLVRESRELAANGNLVNAVFKAQEAVVMAPQNVSAIRLNTEFLTAMRKPEALYFLDRLDQLNATTLQDRKTRVRALRLLSRDKEAASLLEQLLVDNAPDEGLMQLAGEVWGQGTPAPALLAAMRSYAEKHPEDQAHRLRLARLLTRAEGTADAAEGLRLAWELAGDDSDTGLQALGFLAEFERLPPDQSARLIQRLRTHPKAGGWHLAEALTREARLDPARRPKFIQEAIEQARGKTREELLPLVRWLVEQREFAQVVALVNEDEVKTYLPLLENYLTALTFLGRFEDLERLVMDPQVNAILNQTLKAFYRAHLVFVTRKPPAEVRQALSSARAAAELEKRGDLCLRLAQYAEARGHVDIALQAYRSAAGMRQTEREGYQGLIRTAEAVGNSPVMLESSREAVARWPDDPVYLERLLYIQLLLGTSIEASLAEAQRLLEQRPDDAVRLLMAAMGHWRLRDPAGAAAAVAKARPADLSPGQRAVLAAILRGQETSAAEVKARQLALAIDPRVPMLPEERRCLELAVH
jgi:hypothetical protein